MLTAMLLRHVTDPVMKNRVGQFAAVHAHPRPPMMTEQAWANLRQRTLDMLVRDLIMLKGGEIW